MPSHTWYLQVNISNCHIREQIINRDTGERLFRWCIRSLALQARSLPAYNPDGGIANITQGKGHVFTDVRPFSDGYYYLLVNTEGETSIDIAIHTKGELIKFCPSFKGKLPLWCGLTGGIR